jgi:hypothetical protein
VQPMCTSHMCALLPHIAATMLPHIAATMLPHIAVYTCAAHVDCCGTTVETNRAQLSWTKWAMPVRLAGLSLDENGQYAGQVSLL